MRQLRTWLAAQDMETLAMKYVLIGLGQEQGGKAYSAKDLMDEMVRRHPQPDGFVFNAPIEEALENARGILRMTGLEVDDPIPF